MTTKKQLQEDLDYYINLSRELRGELLKVKQERDTLKLVCDNIIYTAALTREGKSLTTRLGRCLVVENEPGWIVETRIRHEENGAQS